MLDGHFRFLLEQHIQMGLGEVELVSDLGNTQLLLTEMLSNIADGSLNHPAVPRLLLIPLLDPGQQAVRKIPDLTDVFHA